MGKALAFFGSVLGLVFGVPTYSFLADAGHQCVRTTGNGVAHDTLDTCHLIMAFSFAAYVMIVSVLGMIAGEKHDPLTYSIFGGLGFVAVFVELYAFIATITIIAMKENWSAIQAASSSLQQSPGTIHALGGVAVAGHALALYGILIAVRWAWKVNFHFTRQEKLVYVEQLREKKARQQGKETWHGVADIDDEHDFQTSGMEKGLRKMFDAKRAAQKKKDKAIEAEIREREEEERVAAEQKDNLF